MNDKLDNNAEPSPIDDDRVSAYLDGALTAAEHEDFEVLLRENEEYRTAVEDLRRVGEAVRGLPKLKLAAGFSERVMQQVQQDATHGVAVHKPSDASARAGMNWRGFLYSAIAIAAALLFVFLSPSLSPFSSSGPNIAHRDTVNTAAAASDDAIAADDAGKRLVELGVPENEQLFEKSSSEAKSPAGLAANIDGLRKSRVANDKPQAEEGLGQVWDDAQSMKKSRPNAGVTSSGLLPRAQTDMVLPKALGDSPSSIAEPVEADEQMTLPFATRGDDFFVEGVAPSSDAVDAGVLKKTDLDDIDRSGNGALDSYGRFGMDAPKSDNKIASVDKFSSEAAQHQKFVEARLAEDWSKLVLDEAKQRARYAKPQRPGLDQVAVVSLQAETNWFLSKAAENGIQTKAPVRSDMNAAKADSLRESLQRRALSVTPGAANSGPASGGAIVSDGNGSTGVVGGGGLGSAGFGGQLKTKGIESGENEETAGNVDSEEFASNKDRMNGVVSAGRAFYFREEVNQQRGVARDLEREDAPGLDFKELQEPADALPAQATVEGAENMLGLKKAAKASVAPATTGEYVLVEAPAEVMLKFVAALGTPPRSVWRVQRDQSIVEEALDMASRLSLHRNEEAAGETQLEESQSNGVATDAEGPTEWVDRQNKPAARFSVDKLEDRTALHSTLTKSDSDEPVRILFYLSSATDTRVTSQDSEVSNDTVGPSADVEAVPAAPLLQQ